MRQFEIWWADLPAPAGRRRVLLLSRNDAYRYLNKFIVAEITTTVGPFPLEVKLGRRGGCRQHASPTSIAPPRASGWIPGRAH